MNKFIVLFILIVSSYQLKSYDDGDKFLDFIDSSENRLMVGDKEVLKEASMYLDSSRVVVRDVWYGTNSAPIKDHCINMIQRYTAFQYLIDDKNLSRKRFDKYLQKFWNQINFSKSIGMLTDINSSGKTDHRLTRIDLSFDSDKLFNEYLNLFKKAISNEEYYTASKYIEKIGALRSHQSYKFIKECAEGKHWAKGKNNRESQTYGEIIFALGYYPTEYSFNTVLNIFDNTQIFDNTLFVNSIAKITNHDLVYPDFFKDTLNKKKELSKKYRELFITYKTLAGVRKAGFKILDDNKEDFAKSIDFYRKIMTDRTVPWWIKYNTLPKLLELKKPDILEIIAKLSTSAHMVYNDPLSFRKYINPIDTIKKYTDTEVIVQDENGIFSNHYIDMIWLLNYINYWEQNYNDWEWDDLEGKFTNKKVEYYYYNKKELLLKQFTSENDSLAINSFINICDNFSLNELDTIKKNRLSIFDQGSPNSLFSFINIDQLIKTRQFTKLCQSNNIQYKADDLVSNHFLSYNVYTSNISNIEGDNIFFLKKKLVENIDLFKLQNKMIDEFTFKHIPMLEYINLVSKDIKSFRKAGIERMIRILYDKHWSKIVSNEEEIKIYLKKASLFDNYIKIRNSETGYITKLSDVDETTLNKIESIAQNCDDIDIKKQALKVLALNGNVDEYSIIKLEDYFKVLDPDIANYITFKQTEQNYQKIIEQIIANATTRPYLFSILELNLSVLAVPSLIEIVVDDRKASEMIMHAHGVDHKSHWSRDINTNSDLATGLLEKIYQFKFIDGNKEIKPISIFDYSSNPRNNEELSKRWKELWEYDSINYKNWGQAFYEDKLLEIVNADSVYDDDLNNIVKSIYRNESDLKIWKNGLQKLIVSGFISIGTDSVFKPDSIDELDFLFEYPEYFHIPYEYVDNYLAISFNRIYKDLQKFNRLEQGKILSKLISMEIVRKALIHTEDRDNLSNEFIRSRVIDYRIERNKNKKESNIFERISILGNENRSEKNPLYFLIENDIKRQFSEALSMKDNFSLIGLMDHVLDSMKYRDLMLLIDNIDTLKFIYKDNYYYEPFILQFGIPVSSDDWVGIKKLKNNYNNMTEFDLYKHYSTKFYSNLFNGKAINYGIVKSALIDDFFEVDGTSIGNVKSIIRLLEIIYKTRLGYDYQFTNIERYFIQRVNAWLSFLEDMN